MQETLQSDCSNEELDALRRAKLGDPDGFRTLVELHHARIYSLEFKQVRNHGVAEELTQEIFVKAFKGIKDFRGSSKFSTWLTRIALNTTYSYFKSRRYKQGRLTVSFQEEHSPIAERGEKEELLQRVTRQLAELPSHHRDVLVLCVMDGRPYEEAARILEIPIGTVRSRMNGAFKRLRRDFWNG